MWTVIPESSFRGLLGKKLYDDDDYYYTIIVISDLIMYIELNKIMNYKSNTGL